MAEMLLDATKRVVTLTVLARLCAEYRKAGLAVAATNGCFDLCHVGHVRFLEQARNRADLLVVLLNSDASVRRAKGPDRPLVPERDRAYQLAALRAVDLVAVFDADDCADALAMVAPAVYVKDKAWKATQNAREKAVLAACGAHVVWLPRTRAVSTTRLAERRAS